LNRDPLRIQSRVREVETRKQMLLTALSGAAAIMSPSRFLRDETVKAGVPRERITLLPYGIEPGVRLARRTKDDVALRIGFLGQIAPHKGVHVLIKAVQALRERLGQRSGRGERAEREERVELIIHGDLTRERAYVRSLRALAADDPRIVFAGPIIDRRLEPLFNSIDILAVPSIWYENAPLVMLEAKRAGLPVLASRLGGMAELVRDDEDGLLAEPGSPVSFARQLERLITEPDLIDRLRQHVTPPASIDDEVRALIDVYERASCSVPALAAGGNGHA
jgi:glycosyltransferase involved in cell wall biosynthesis